jgi:hypothetical protein
MEWSRIRSIAHEAEFWMSLAVNSWLIYRGTVFLVVRVSRSISPVTNLLASGALLSSVALLYAMPITIIVSLFRQDESLIFWQMGIGIALSIFSLMIRTFEAGRFLPSSN